MHGRGQRIEVRHAADAAVVRQEVVGAARLDHPEPGLPQRAAEQRALVRVAPRQGAEERRRHAEQRDGGLLQRRRRLHHQRVVHGPNGRRQARRREHPADPPAGGVGGLGDRVDDDGPLAHAGPRGDRPVARAVEDDVLVDLVRDHDEVLRARHRGDRLQIVGCEHLPGGVVRGVEHEQTGSGRGAPQLVRVEPPRRAVRLLPQGDEAGLEPEDLRLRRVHLVERLQQDDAVAAAAGRGEHRGQSLGGAEHHRRLGLRVGLEPAPARRIGGDGLPQLGQAERIGVLVQLVAPPLQRLQRVPQRRRRPAGAGVGKTGRRDLLESSNARVAAPQQRRDRAPDEGERRRLVGEPLRQVDGPVPLRQARHAPDDRFAGRHRRSFYAGPRRPGL